MMNQSSPRPKMTFMSFVGMGIFLVLMIAGIFLLSALLIWGAVIGIVLFAISYIKQRLFPSKKKGMSPPSGHSGRTFEHDDSK